MSKMRSAKVIKVIMTEHCEGEGTVENLSRIVTCYWTLDGKLLAEHDPCCTLRCTLSAKAEASEHD